MILFFFELGDMTHFFDLKFLFFFFFRSSHWRNTRPTWDSRCFLAAMAFRRAGACALRRRLLPTLEPSLQTRALHVSAARRLAGLGTALKSPHKVVARTSFWYWNQGQHLEMQENSSKNEMRKKKVLLKKTKNSLHSLQPKISTPFSLLFLFI